MILRWFVALAMMAIGAMHFIDPAAFVRIVPSFLPAPLFLVYASGVAEIALGAGLFWERTRRLAAWGLVALYVAVFPANINMAVNHLHDLPEWVAWARLPFQALFIALAVRMAR